MAAKKNGGNPPEVEVEETVVAENGEAKKTPLVSFDYPGSPGSLISVALWENEITLPSGETAMGHAATFNRSFKTNGSWRRTASFRLNDLLVLQFAIGKAIDYLMENRNRQHS